MLSKKFLLLAGTALLAPIVSSAETETYYGYRLSDGANEPVAGGNFYGPKSLGEDSGTYYQKHIEAGVVDQNWDSSKNAFLEDGKYISIDYLFVLGDGATFTNTDAFKLISKDPTSVQLNEGVSSFENHAILFDKSVLKNEGSFSYDLNGGAIPTYFTLVGTSRLENSGTVSGSGTPKEDNSGDLLEFALMDSSSFINLENGKFNGAYARLSNNATFENNGAIDSSSLIRIEDNGGFTNNKSGTFSGTLLCQIRDDETANRVIENYGTFSGTLAFLINPKNSTVRFSSTSKNTMTFENHGTVSKLDIAPFEKWVSYGELIRVYNVQQLENIATKNRWNIKNYGTIEGDVSLGSIFTLTLVGGSNITGNVSLGEDDKWSLRTDSGDTLNTSALSEKSFLNVVLNGNDRSNPLISGTLTLSQEADLTVSSESSSMKQSVKIYNTLSDSDYSLPTAGTFTNNGEIFNWTLDLTTGVLSAVSSEYKKEVTITDGSATESTTAGTYLTLDSSITDFSGTISGAGEVAIDHNVALSGDLSEHSGLLPVVNGTTLTVENTAKLGSGKIDIADAGEIQINGGTQTLNQNISGNGTLSATNFASIELAGSVNVGNVSIDETSTLSGSANLNQTTLELAGKLALDAVKGESVSLTAGSVVCKSTAKLSLTKTDTTSAAATDETSELIAKLKAGERVTVFSGTGTVSFENSGAEEFLETDETLSTLAASNIILYRNTRTELSAILVSDFSGVIDIPAPDGLDKAFVDALVDKDAITATVGTSGFVSESSLAGDPILAASLADDTATAQKIARNASPLGYAAMLATPISAFYNDAQSVSARLAQRRADNASAQNAGGNGWEFFAQAQGSSVENDDASDAPTFDFDTYGVFVGADFSVSKTLTAGVALGYETGSADIHDDGGDIDLSDFRLVAFLGKSFENNIFVNAGVHAGYGDYDATRKSAYGESSGDTNGWNAGVFADAGIRFDFEYGLSITPYVGLAFAHAEVDSFDETGGKALGLDSFSGESLRARIGCAGAWDFLIAETPTNLGLDLAFSHDFLGDEADIDYSLGGKNFTATAQLLPENTISVSPSIGVAITESTRVYAAYTFAAGTDSAISHSANLGFSYRF